MQTIDRTFAVLRALAEAEASAGVSDVARRAGLPKSTTSRILASLADLGMVDRLDDRYVVGQGLAALTRNASEAGSLRDVARPYLVDLAERFGESAALGVLDGDEMLYIDTAVSEGVVQVQDWTGRRFPPHTVSAGLALMTSWSDDLVTSYGQREFETFTEKSISNLSQLRERLKQVRRAGVAWTMAEFDDEINGVAAPVVDPQGNAVGAINVSGPVYRFPGDRSPDDIAAELIGACRQISDRLH